jgi:hypothetical protein
LPRVPKALFGKDVWTAEEEEELMHYIDWHAQHPRCISPRPVKPDDVK